MIRLTLYTFVLSLVLCVPSWAQTGIDFSLVVGEGAISDRVEIYKVDVRKTYVVNGDKRTINGAFQPSVLLDGQGQVHVFFQARLDSSDDRAEKMIAHVISRDGGQTFTEPTFVQDRPMQTYAMSAFTRKNPAGGERISLLTSLSIDETIDLFDGPEAIKEALGIDVRTFSRKVATLILEFYSDDGGESWTRKEHRNVSDKVYQRNGKSYYLAFINLIGQVRRIEEGPYKGRLILSGPLRGDYLPRKDLSRFRMYSSSSSLIYSDDDGESWKFGGVVNDETAFVHNEASAIPVNGGKQILMVRRANSKEATHKVLHYNNDGGESWEDGFVSTITATRCLQVMESFGDYALCATPGTRGRMKGQIYFSQDAGQTWAEKEIEPSLFSYSTLNRLSGPYLICAYSQGHHGEIRISAKIFHMDWLKD